MNFRTLSFLGAAVVSGFLQAAGSFQVYADDHDVSLERAAGKWVLFYIEIMPEADELERLGIYDSMFDCFDAWTKAEDMLPKPKINFQIICIRMMNGIQPIKRM